MPAAKQIDVVWAAQRLIFSKNTFIMKKAIALAVIGLAAGFQALAVPAKNIGDITVQVDNRMLSVRVSANTPELNALAQAAFRAHGRYNVTSNTNAQYEIKFTAAGGNQVKVDVLRGGSTTPVHSQVLSGTSPRNALLKAADVAVEKTNGLGLKGFFASKLTFINESTGKREVYVGDLFFGEVKRITTDKASALSPRWSPDGGKIIYTSFYKSGFPDVFVIETGSYSRSTFASFKGTNSGARFSPNGAQVAMVLSGEGNPELYVTSSSAGKPRRLTFTKDSVEASPCFSPDSSRIVYTSDVAGGPQLYVIPTAGGTPTRLSTGVSSYCAEPDWSRAKPNMIAFTARTGGYQIAVYDMNTGKGTSVSKAPYDAVEPSWLADGRHLVYTARDKATSVLCILDTETGKSTKISGPLAGQTCQASVLAP
jgi:TolB protein